MQGRGAEGGARLFGLLPERLAAEICMLSGGRASFSERLEELRLRAPGKSSVVLGGAHRPLQARLSRAELEALAIGLCGGSLYAYEECIARGYLPFEGGIRIGVCGHARYEGEVLRGVFEIGALVIRLPHAHKEEAEALTEAFMQAHRGLLIYAPPGVGKTTALRTLALALGTRVPPMRVVVIDERMELDPEEFSEATVDILRGYHRVRALEIAYRSMNPEVVMMDEIGGREEADGLSSLLRGGALAVATAHAGSPEDLRQRGALRPFFERGCFDAFLGIRRGKTGMVYDLHKEDEEVQKVECFGI